MVSSLIEKVARRFKRKTAELPAGDDEAALDSASANADTHDNTQHLGASSAQSNDVVARHHGVEASAEDLDSEVVLPLGKHAARPRDAHDASPLERGRHAAARNSAQASDAAPLRQRGRHASPAKAHGLHATVKAPSSFSTETEFGRHAALPAETRENSSAVESPTHAISEASRRTSPSGGPKHVRTAERDAGRKNGPRHAK